MEDKQHQWHSVCNQLTDAERDALLQSLRSQQKNTPRRFRPPAWWRRFGEYITVGLAGAAGLALFPYNPWSPIIAAVGLLSLRYRHHLNIKVMRILLITLLASVVALQIALHVPQPAALAVFIGVTAVFTTLALTAAYLLRPVFTHPSEQAGG